MLHIFLKNYLNICFILLIFIAPFTKAESEILWQATYYQALPNKANISNDYCQQHTPGTFTGKVTNQLLNGAVTDKNIKLDHFTFYIQKKHGIYFMSGSVIAHGVTNNIDWHDKIYYYVYKLTVDDVTRGVWSSNTCKGLYLGKVINN